MSAGRSTTKSLLENREPVARNRQDAKNWELDKLRKENERLKELVINLTKIVVKNVMDRK